MQLKSATVTPSYSHNRQVGVVRHRVAGMQAEIVVAIHKIMQGDVVNMVMVVLITVQMEEVAEVEIGGARGTKLSSFTHQLHPPGQEGVGVGGTEKATGTTLTNVLVVGIDGDIRTRTDFTE